MLQTAIHRTYAALPPVSAFFCLLSLWVFCFRWAVLETRSPSYWNFGFAWRGPPGHWIGSSLCESWKANCWKNHRKPPSSYLGCQLCASAARSYVARSPHKLVYASAAVCSWHRWLMSRPPAGLTCGNQVCLGSWAGRLDVEDGSSSDISNRLSPSPSSRKECKRHCGSGTFRPAHFGRP